MKHLSPRDFEGRFFRQTLFFLFLSFLFCTSSLSAQVSCANNNDDAPPYIPGSDPSISVNEVDVTADNTPSSLCIGDASDPDSDTNGCGTFRFTNLPTGNGDCPSYFCFTPKQGCGAALGNVCVWIEGIDQDTWGNVGTIDDSNGFTRICVASDPSISTFDVTVCRPGNGPVSIADIEIFLPPDLGLPDATNICSTDLPTSVDLTALETTGFTGGTWSSTQVAVTDPANVTIDNTFVPGDCIMFDYSVDASFTVPGSDDPAGPVIDVPCIVADTIKYTITDVCSMPGIAIDKHATDGTDSQSVPPGGTATFEIVVSNTGDVDLQNVVVSDPAYPECDMVIPLIAAGASSTYTCTVTNVTSGFMNFATATGEPVDGNTPVSDSDGSSVMIAAGSISIEKRAVDGMDTQSVPPGGTATFEIIVMNTGGTDLENVTVSDPIAPDCDNVIGSLAAGATVTYTCTITNVQAGFTNTVGVTGDPVGGGAPLTDSDTSEVTLANPGLTVVKTAGDGTDTQTVNDGGTATFEIIVTNSGDVDLENVAVVDPVSPACDMVIGTLAVGTSVTYTCTLDDVAAGFINIANATGTPVGGGDPVAGTDDTEVVLAVPSILIDKHALNGTDNQQVNPGATAEYEIVVTNNGSVDLENVVVSDPNSPDCDNVIGNLAVGETVTYTCSFPGITTGFINTSLVTGDPVGGGSPVTDIDDTEVVLTAPSITIEKRALDGFDLQTIPPGGTAFFEIVVFNSGNVELVNVAISDPLVADCDNAAITTLAVGETVVYTCQIANVSADFVNTIDITGEPLGGGTPVTDTDDSAVAIGVVGLDVSKTAIDGTDSQIISPGGTASFEITVTNTGDFDLENVTVADPLSPGCDTNIAFLPAGESVTYSCTIDNLAAGFINTATATGTPVGGGDPVTGTDDTEVLLGTPELTIVKTAADGTDLQTLNPGQTATFEITVSNTGDVDLTNVAVSDPLTPNCDNIIGDFPAGASVTYTCFIDNVTNGFINVADVNGDPVDGGTPVSGTDDTVVDVTNPSIILVKTAADGTDSQTINPGQPAVFQITVTNNGDVDLENVFVNDPAAPLCNNLIGNLAVGQSVTYTCTLDNPAASFVNTATATGDPVGGGTPVSDADDTGVTVTMPGIVITKSSVDGSDPYLVNPGATATFVITVENTGNVLLENVVVSDPQTPACDAVFATLAVGEVQSYTCTVDNVQAGFVNVADVTAVPEGGGDPVTGTDDVEVVLTNPGIAITKTAADGTDSQFVNPGGTATFEITVENTGDVVLENVVITDPLAPSCDAIFATLAVGEIQTYTCTVIDVQTGFINVADVIADPQGGGDQVGGTDDTEVILTNPGISITKTGLDGLSPIDVFPGFPATFEITVENTGDVALENVVVTDPVSPSCDTVIPNLAVGESVTYTCVLDGQFVTYVNVATVTGDPVGGGYPVTDEDEVEVLVSCPEIILACNNEINVSLDANCEAVITADMLLEGDFPTDYFLVIELFDEEGNSIGNTIGPDQVGQTLTAMLFDTCEEPFNSCWGSVFVEDKLAPIITCPEDSTLDLICSDADAIFTPDVTVLEEGEILDTGNPTVDENCGIYTVTYSDVLIEGGNCEDDVIVRTFVATDASGNTSSCTQNIPVRKPDFSDVTVPGEVLIECDLAADISPQVLYELGYDGLPLVTTFYGDTPIYDTYCNLGISYTDGNVIPLCGTTYKIIRQWTIFDWCTGASYIHNQLIKVLDTTAPTFECPEYDPIIATQGVCEGTVTILPVLNYDDNCSAQGETIVTLTAPDGSTSTHSVGDEVVLIFGNYDITYSVADACGNVGDICSSSIVVMDETPPVAICDQHTVASIDQSGSAFVCWQTFDDGSYDNCSNIYIRVKRMDAANSVTFTECVEFDCSDVGETIMVRMRVYDVPAANGFPDNDSGRFNECMVEVTVQDKLAPQITCPANKVLDCQVDYSSIPELSDNSNDGLPVFYNGELAGYYAGASDNCNATITVEDSGSIDNCGEGVITRTWTATDDGSYTASCVQTITLTNASPFEAGDISWPANHDVNCGSGLGTNPEDLPDGRNFPGITEDACDLVAVTYEDQLLEVNGDACYKIIRNWIVVDWCTFDETVIPYEGYYTYSQVIKVYDDLAPVITSSCEDFEVCNYSEDCGATNVELILEAEDACADDLNYSYAIDAFNDGVADSGSAFNGESNNASGNYPNGTHRIYWTVEDGCGNITTCDYTFTVSDCKKPTPILINGLATVVMPSSGAITLWATDFNAPNSSSFDNCTDSEDLLFAIRIVDADNTTLTSVDEVLALGSDVVFTCDHLGFAEVEVYVVDEAGNWDFGITYAVIQDPNGTCGINELADVSGAVYTEEDEMVSDVNVSLDNQSTAIPDFLTSSSGYFQFAAPMHQNYVVAPERNTDALNGVTTFDLVLISKHILGLGQLDSPYKIIAADANASGTVTTFDLVTLRRLILNIDTELANNTSWRFVDADFVFADPSNPFATAFPEVISINDLDANEEANDFIAVKIGDVNGSALPNTFAGVVERAPEHNLVFNLKDQKIVAGENYNIEFTSADFKDVLGYQFTLNFDATALEFAGMENGKLSNLSEANFGFAMLDKGIITTSWNESKAVSLKDGEVLFSLQFTATANGTLSKLLNVSSQFTKAEAYSTNEDLAIALAFVSDNSTTVASTEFELYQNTPNPVVGKTTIGFQLPEAATATLRIFDISGKEILSIEDNFAKGYNEVSIDREQLNASGMIYYELGSNTDKAVMKMILVD